MIKRHAVDLILILLGVFALISFGYALNDKPPRTVTEYKDWPVYVDQMPAVCYQMVEAALDLREIELERQRADLKIATFAANNTLTLNQLAAKKKAIEAARKLEKPLERAADRFEKQADACSNA